jgi:hypothetical protein
MLVLAMEFSRGTGRRATPSKRRSDDQEREVGSPKSIPLGAGVAEEDRTGPKTRRRSLKTEQRCPTILAAPHGRPMVYDREMLGQPNSQ